MLNTKDIPESGGGGLPKTLSPGIHKVKINIVELEDFKFKPDSLYLLLHVEGEPIGDDFEGFAIDKDDATKGHHKGQIGRVKSDQWAYADGTTKSGIEISRDMEILKFIKNLCTELNCMDWLQNQDGKHATIQSLIEAFNNDAPFKDIWLNMCLAGKEYKNKNGYDAYDLFLPRYSKTGAPFEGIGKAKSNLVTYDPSVHIKKKNVESVNSFESDGATDEVRGDFKL